MIDQKDWNKPYINKSYWIFDNLDQLNLEASEALVVLVINFLNETKTPITYETLTEKCHLSAEEVDECFESLSAKGYLTIDTQNQGLRFLLEGMLNSPIKAGQPLNQSLLSEFQQEFAGRTFSPSDMERILAMQERYDERMIIRALDEAAAYDKRNLNYIESILLAWTQKGLSVEDIESGRR